METKYVKVPFDVELAKKITNGEVDGKIVTRDGRNARIVCWDMKSDDCIVAIIQDEFREHVYTLPNDGCRVRDVMCGSDLMLEIPEYMTFKDGDVLTYWPMVIDGAYSFTKVVIKIFYLIMLHMIVIQEGIIY